MGGLGAKEDTQNPTNGAQATYLLIDQSQTDFCYGGSILSGLFLEFVIDLPKSSPPQSLVAVK